MLLGFLEDAKKIDGLQLTTTWDARLGAPPAQLDRCHVIDHPAEESRRFPQLVRESDAVLLIAPEFSDLLLDRAAWVESLGKPLIGPQLPAIKLCGDKLQLAQRLTAAEVPTIETTALPPNIDTKPPFPFPTVVKPRQGAGSQQTYLVNSEQEWSRLSSNLADFHELGGPIAQPYLSGTPLSIAAIVDRSGHVTHQFPLAEQHFSDDRRFTYLGGKMPTRTASDGAMGELFNDICVAVPGLTGYIGVDLILPHDPQLPLTVVEVNPRLTTSYLGYRALTADNLAARLLFLDNSPLRWRPGVVEFSADGRTNWLESQESTR